MSIRYNGTTLENVVFNGTTCDVIKCNGVEVFRRKLIMYNYGTYGSLASTCSIKGNASGYSLTTGSNYLQCNAPSKSNSWTTAYFPVAVDLTNYKKLTMRMYCTGFAYAFGIQKTPTYSTGGAGNQAYGYTKCISGELQNSGSYDSTATIDLSSISGSYYITFTCAGSSSGYGGIARLYSAILEA